MTPSALDGVLVLELASGVSAGFAGKLLADLGARGGDGRAARRARRCARHGAVRLPRRRQALARARATSATCVRGWTGADVVLTDGTSPWHAAAVDGRPDRAVLVDLSAVRAQRARTPSWASSDLVTWAMGGYLYFTGSPGPRADLAARPAGASSTPAPHAAFAALVGLHEREPQRPRPARRGQPSSRPRSPRTRWLVSSWAANGRSCSAVPNDLIRAVDGWVYVMRIVPKDELFVMIDRPDLGAEGLTVDLPDVEREHPADLRGGRRVGRRQDRRRDRRVRAAAAGRGDAGRRRRRRARRRAARGARLVGARGRRRLPGPAVQVLGHARRRAAVRRRPSVPSAATPPTDQLPAALPGGEPASADVRAAARGRADHRGHDELGRPRRRPVPRRPRRRQRSRSSGPRGPATRALVWAGPEPGPAAPGPPPRRCTSTR